MSPRFRRIVRCSDNDGDPTFLQVHVSDNGTVSIHATPRTPAHLSAWQVSKLRQHLLEAQAVALHLADEQT